MAEASVPTSFRHQDSVAVDGSVGRWPHAHVLRDIADGQRYIAGRCLRRLINQSWDIVGSNTELYDTLIMSPASRWSVIIAPMRVPVSSTVDRARVRVYAGIDNLTTVRMAVCSRARPFRDFALGATDIMAMAGNGTAREYPLTGDYFVPLRPDAEGFEKIAVLLFGDENTAAPAPLDTGTVLWMTDVQMFSTGENFTNLDDSLDWYVHFSDGAGTILSDQYHVTSTFNESLSFWPQLSVPPHRMTGRTWHINRGPRIQLGNISIYEELPTGL